MSFLTAEKRTTLPVAPRGGRDKTYLGNARSKTFLFVCTPSLKSSSDIKFTIVRIKTKIKISCHPGFKVEKKMLVMERSGGKQIFHQISIKCFIHIIFYDI